MTVQFLSGLFQLPFDSSAISLTGGGTFSAPVTLNLFITGQNRAGFSLPSSIVTISATASQAIQVTLPPLARGTTDGGRKIDYFYYWLSHTPTGVLADGFVIGGWSNYEYDQVTLKTLGAISLSKNAHIAINTTVANEAALPTGTDLIYGMVRGVTSVNGGLSPSGYYRYNPLEPKVVNGRAIICPPGQLTQKWVLIGPPYLGLITDPTSIDGCAQRVSSLDPSLFVLSAPLYGADGTKGIGVNYCVYNDTGSVMGLGTVFSIQVQLAGELKSYLFDKKLVVNFHGYVDHSTGNVDKTDILGNMPNVDADMVWSYGDRGNLFLPKDLPAGWGAWFEIAPRFTLSQIAGQISEGTPILLNIVQFLQSGEFAGSLAAILGNTVLPISNKLRVVPGVGLSATLLGGSALVARYIFPDKGAQEVYGLVPSQANQIITIDGNGSVFNRTGNAIPATEVTRAIISTSIGYATPSNYVNVTLASTGGFTFTCSLPCFSNGNGTIRSDYSLIGGNTQGKFNPPFICLYIKNPSNTIYRITATAVPGVTQVIAVSSLGSTTVGTLPTSPSSNFSLFNAPGLNIATTTGTIPAGAYQVTAGYYFDGSTVSSIVFPDGSNGGIDEISQTIIAALTSISGVGANIAELLSRTTYSLISSAVTGSVNRKHIATTNDSFTLPSPSGWLEVENTSSANLSILAPSTSADGIVIPPQGRGLFVASGSDWKFTIEGRQLIQVVTSMPFTAQVNKKYLFTVAGTVNIPAAVANTIIELSNGSTGSVVLSRAGSLIDSQALSPGAYGYLWGGTTEWTPINVSVPKGSLSFTYTGAEQIVNTPSGIFVVDILAWGGAGASTSSLGGAGGAGGWYSITVTIATATTIAIFVGQGGQGSVGGVGGGGNGGAPVGTGVAGGGGGGRSYIKINGTIVALAGGGGGGGGTGASTSFGSPGAGGAAGGTAGLSGGSASTGGSIGGGVGATQTTGNALITGGNGSAPVAPGVGGANSGGGGGGGGGLYGGGGGLANTTSTDSTLVGLPGGGGAGGSGFTGTGITVNQFLAGSGRSPSGMTDVAYAGNAGLGGTAGANGSNGLVIVRWRTL